MGLLGGWITGELFFVLIDWFFWVLFWLCQILLDSLWLQLMFLTLPFSVGSREVSYFTRLSDARYHLCISRFVREVSKIAHFLLPFFPFWGRNSKRIDNLCRGLLRFLGVSLVFLRSWLGLGGFLSQKRWFWRHDLYKIYLNSPCFYRFFLYFIILLPLCQILLLSLWLQLMFLTLPFSVGSREVSYFTRLSDQSGASISFSTPREVSYFTRLSDDVKR